MQIVMNKFLISFIVGGIPAQGLLPLQQQQQQIIQNQQQSTQQAQAFVSDFD